MHFVFNLIYIYIYIYIICTTYEVNWPFHKLNAVY